MERPKTDTDTSSTSTQQPGEGREAAGDSKEGLSEPLAEEHVNTQEQRNQSWTQGGSQDARRDDEGEPMRTDDSSPPTLDMPDELESKLDDVVANPSNETEPTHDTGGELGGMPKTGSGEQDPMGQMGGGQSGG